MDKMNRKLEHLEESIQTLLRKTDLLHIDNQVLKNKNAELEALVERQKNIIKDIEENNKIVKIAESISNTKADQSELKGKIDEYLKEIDRCIALLSS